MQRASSSYVNRSSAPTSRARCNAAHLVFRDVVDLLEIRDSAILLLHQTRLLLDIHVRIGEKERGTLTLRAEEGVSADTQRSIDVHAYRAKVSDAAVDGVAYGELEYGAARSRCGEYDAEVKMEAVTHVCLVCVIR